MMEERLATLRARLPAEALDAILITQPENRRYLSGFTGSAGVLLISAQDALLLTDFRYYERAQNEAPDYQLVKVEGKLPPLIAKTVAEVGVKRIGIESMHLTVDTYRSWRDAAQYVEMVLTKHLILRLRARKDAAELGALRKAIAVADAAFAHILTVIKLGMTEQEAAWEVESYMRPHGAAQVAFDSIVGSGVNGAMPHASASERRIRVGEPIVMDFGARVDGYNSDLTRTIILGKPDDRFREIHGLVASAQKEAERRIRPGMTGAEADRIARDVIEEAGFGQSFGHGLGHGVGLAVHELPSASKTSEDPLEPGAVISVEPGVYLPGWGGVRIEDLVLITDSGIEVLTHASKEPVVTEP